MKSHFFETNLPLLIACSPVANKRADYRVFHVALTDFEALLCKEKTCLLKIEDEILFSTKGHL